MLSAYLDWTHRATEQELQATVPHLWLVEHRAPGLAQPLRVGGYHDPEQAVHNPRMQSLHAAVGRVPVPVDRR